jgi:hypothetical protein
VYEGRGLNVQRSTFNVHRFHTGSPSALTITALFVPWVGHVTPHRLERLTDSECIAFERQG